MKGLIIAAGRGSRLGSVTDDTPKPLVNVTGKSFFENTVDHFRACGVTDIAAVVGYQREQFYQYSDLTFFENKTWRSNNILHSMFCARDFLDQEVMVAYGDIWFEERAIKKMSMAGEDISIAVDEEWTEYYEGRTDHPIAEAEVVYFDGERQACRTGKNIGEPERHHQVGEFMGLLKFSATIIEQIVEEFERLKESVGLDERFQNAERFENAYLTDFIQHLILKSYSVNCCINTQGWAEVDTLQDLTRLEQRLSAKGEA